MTLLIDPGILYFTVHDFARTVFAFMTIYSYYPLFVYPLGVEFPKTL